MISRSGTSWRRTIMSLFVARLVGSRALLHLPGRAVTSRVQRHSMAALSAQGPQVAAPMPARADAVLSYWFGPDYAHLTDTSEAVWQQQQPIWFSGGAAVDKDVAEKFSGDIKAIAAGDYDDWARQTLSSVAGVILMDQFTRNVYRDTPQMYDLDPKALEWALKLVDSGDVWNLPAVMRAFVMMPLMHSEDREVQERCIALFKENTDRFIAAHGEESTVLGRIRYFYDPFALAHHAVVKKWGRFPHRNALLGRQSTPEEVQGLADGSIGAW